MTKQQSFTSLVGLIALVGTTLVGPTVASAGQPAEPSGSPPPPSGPPGFEAAPEAPPATPPATPGEVAPTPQPTQPQPAPSSTPPAYPAPVPTTAPPPQPVAAPPAGQPATPPVSNPVAPPTAASAAPVADAAPGTDGPNYTERSARFGAVVGVRFCGQSDWCGSDGLKAGPTARGALGYRLKPYLEIGADLGFALQPVDVPEGDARGLSWSLAGYLLAYPWRSGIWHPYVGLGVGVNQDRLRYSYEGEQDQTWWTRGLVRASLGLDVFVTDRIAIGPRIDYDLQFSGKICDESTDIKKDCVSFSDVDGGGDFPRWLVIGLGLKTKLGGKRK